MKNIWGKTHVAILVKFFVQAIVKWTSCPTSIKLVDLDSKYPQVFSKTFSWTYDKVLDFEGMLEKNIIFYSKEKIYKFFSRLNNRNFLGKTKIFGRVPKIWLSDNFLSSQCPLKGFLIGIKNKKVMTL